jgi:cytochrome c peroxidase
MHGDEAALDDGEQRGAALFVGKARCASCHTGAYFTDGAFHNVGLRPALVLGAFLDGDDHGAAVGLRLAQLDPLNSVGRFSDAPGGDGRLAVSITEGMEGAFRTPGLRCVSRRSTFMHTGQIATLEGVIAFFDGGGHEAGFHGKSEIGPLGLSPSEIGDLAAFLRALDGPGPAPELLAAPEGGDRP